MVERTCSQQPIAPCQFYNENVCRSLGGQIKPPTFSYNHVFITSALLCWHVFMRNIVCFFLPGFFSSLLYIIINRRTQYPYAGFYVPHTQAHNSLSECNATIAAPLTLIYHLTHNFYENFPFINTYKSLRRRYNIIKRRYIFPYRACVSTRDSLKEYCCDLWGLGPAGSPPHPPTDSMNNLRLHKNTL